MGRSGRTHGTDTPNGTPRSEGGISDRHNVGRGDSNDSRNRARAPVGQSAEPHQRRNHHLVEFRADVLRGPLRDVLHPAIGDGTRLLEGDGRASELPFSATNTTILVLSSLTCQLGVFAAERGDVKKLRTWFIVTFVMGSIFIGGQVLEYTELVKDAGLSLSSDPYGSVFYLTTGFHGLHVTGGLIAFLLVLGRTYAAKRFTHDQATAAIVVSYYWHFVDVVWIGLFATIYMIK